MPRRFLLLLYLSILLSMAFQPAFAQAVGDTIRLESSNPQGVPVHPAAGDASYVRWANGTVGVVRAIDPATGWFQVESAGKLGWITSRYIIVIPLDPDPEPQEDELPAYIIGAWNLEHFRNGATRGFPENTHGGPSYGPRTDADFEGIARIITAQLFAKILILSEINGRSGSTRSDELDRLVGFLGANWAYELTAAGRSQRVAILYDSSAARRVNCVEFTVPAHQIDGKDVFERDPLACLFVLRDAAQAQDRNDLIVVGLHLASGQQLVNNHSTAMEILRTRLHQALADGTFPAGERDILIGGDLNASRYDSQLENFWEGYDSGRFRFVTLSPADGTQYPGTRLAGVPLFPRSQIDYLIASGQTGGLMDELVQAMAHVHIELLGNDFNDFRTHVSDHIPVTVRVRVVPDDD